MARSVTMPERVRESLEPLSRQIKSRIPAWSDGAGEPRLTAAHRTWLIAAALIGVGVAALLLRFWAIHRLGLNSDEAVYSGQAATLAGDEAFAEDFSIFRAHPLLFQFLLSLVYRMSGEVTDTAGRYLAAIFGVLTIPVVYLIGKTLFNKRVGTIAMVIVAVMPYHIIVSRQAMLESPLTFFLTLTILILVWYRQTPTWPRAVALGTSAGLTFMSKEVGALVLVLIAIVLLVEGRGRWRDAPLIFGAFCLTVAPHLAAMRLGGGGEGGGSWVDYVIWQIGRPPNHPASFYISNLVASYGVPLLVLLIGGLVLAMRRVSADKRYLIPIVWLLFPAFFFQIWKVRGFHYIVPVVGAVAILAALLLDELWERRTTLTRVGAGLITGITVVSLIWLSATSGSFVDDYSRVGDAGYSGIPGGRETAIWLRDNAPEGVHVLGIGPSIGNILRWYGHIEASALSISPNPLRANPAYDPVRNPDYLLRWGLVEYLIYDVYSAQRTPHFANRLLDFAEHYAGEIVHEEFATRIGDDGEAYLAPVIRVYRVAPVTSNTS